MHVKPPETGQPFPLHQDWPFYPHSDGRYVDVLVHLDDTGHENGEIRFLDGSHKLGVLEHITETSEGPCTPYLPFHDYRLEDTTSVSAQAGDVVCFNICTIHGSYLNTTDAPRRLVVFGGVEHGTFARETLKDSLKALGAVEEPQIGSELPDILHHRW